MDYIIRKAELGDVPALAAVERACFPVAEAATEEARQKGRQGVVLTYKEKLLPYYSKFGFVN